MDICYEIESLVISNTLDTNMNVSSDVSYNTLDKLLLNIKSLSLDDKSVLLNDVFENERDIYASYNNPEIPFNKPNTIEQLYHNTDIHNTYKTDNTHMLGISTLDFEINTDEYHNDEDYIHKFLILPESIKSSIYTTIDSHLYKNNLSVNGLEKYCKHLINTDVIFAKTVYIYEYVQYYYSNELHYLTPKQRILYMPSDMLQYINTIICICKTIIDRNMMDTQIDTYSYNSINRKYFLELVYGVNITVCYIKIILNHLKKQQISFWSMTESYIIDLFKILNNFCSIIIFMRIGC